MDAYGAPAAKSTAALSVFAASVAGCVEIIISLLKEDLIAANVEAVIMAMAILASLLANIFVFQNGLKDTRFENQ